MASKQELIVRSHIDKLFEGFHILYNWRPDFLQNERTGKNLEYDIYIGKFHAAIEFQGAVHFKRIERYRNDPDRIKYNDVLKEQLSKSNCKKSLSIIEIFDVDLVGDFIVNFKKRIRNTIEYNEKHRLFKNAFNLFKMLFFIEHGVLEKPEINCICHPEYIKQSRKYKELESLNNIYENSGYKMLHYQLWRTNKMYLISNFL